MLNLQKKSSKLCSGKKCSLGFVRSNLIDTPATESNKCIFQYNKKPSVFNINKYQTAIFIYKSLHNLSPSCFQNLFRPLSNVHTHNTRLPSFIRDSNTCSLFSKNMKLFYLNSLEGIPWWWNMFIIFSFDQIIDLNYLSNFCFRCDTGRILLHESTCKKIIRS